MLSGTSYLSSPHCWPLCWVPASTETFPVHGLGGKGQGQLFLLAVPWESEPCCCLSSLLIHSTSMTFSHKQERPTAVSLHVPAQGMPH